MFLKGSEVPLVSNARGVCCATAALYYPTSLPLGRWSKRMREPSSNNDRSRKQIFYQAKITSLCVRSVIILKVRRGSTSTPMSSNGNPCPRLAVCVPEAEAALQCAGGV